jgi:hypothetical protein
MHLTVVLICHSHEYLKSALLSAFKFVKWPASFAVGGYGLYFLPCVYVLVFMCIHRVLNEFLSKDVIL